jgi:hypothetical protein
MKCMCVFSFRFDDDKYTICNFLIKLVYLVMIIVLFHE